MSEICRCKQVPAKVHAHTWSDATISSLSDETGTLSV